MDDNLPLVSVVIPAYNLARYLDEAIQSVLGQDYPNIELIVLDDGSTDDTRTVLERYGDRFRWETHANMGQAATLNKGWNTSRGEVLAYLSADDVLLPHAVSTSVRHLKANPGGVMVYCDFNLIDPSSRVVRQVILPDFDYRELVTRSIRPPGPGAFFWRDAYEAAGPWDGSLRQTPDYEFWLRLGLEGKFLRIPEVLAALRVHEESQSFARMNESRAEEYVRVTTNYYRSPRVPPEVRVAEPEALSSAHLVTARAHLRSGRRRAALGNLSRAWSLCPTNVLSTTTLRLVVNGLFNQAGHRIWWTLRKLGPRWG